MIKINKILTAIFLLNNLKSENTIAEDEEMVKIKISECFEVYGSQPLNHD